MAERPTTISARESVVTTYDGCCKVSSSLTATSVEKGKLQAPLPAKKLLCGSAAADPRTHQDSSNQQQPQTPHHQRILMMKGRCLPHTLADGTSAPTVQCAGNKNGAAHPKEQCKLQQDQAPPHCRSGHSCPAFHFACTTADAGNTSAQGRTGSAHRSAHGTAHGSALRTSHGSAHGAAQGTHRRRPSDDILPDGVSLSVTDFTCAGPAAKQTCVARTKLLQEVAQQRDLLHLEVLSKRKLRCKINSSFSDGMSRLKGSFTQAMSAQDDHEAGVGDHGQAAAVSTAVEQRLQALQELVVPTAIEHQQQARRALQDRDMGLLHTLKFKWQDYTLARRLRRIAEKSKTAARGASVTAADRKPDPIDPLVDGVRPVMRDAKLPEWLLGFRPGFNPDADAFWLERQWRTMPFSAALADAEEYRQQREGAGWYGGPKTEAGMLVFEERQLRSMLQEQRAALSKIRLRLMASKLPGMHRLETVPLLDLLGSWGTQTAVQRAGTGAVLPVSTAARALARNVHELELLLQANLASQAQRCKPGSTKQQQARRCKPGSTKQQQAGRCKPGSTKQQQNAKSALNKAVHPAAAAVEVAYSNKQRMGPAEMRVLREHYRAEELYSLEPSPLDDMASSQKAAQQLHKATGAGHTASVHFDVADPAVPCLADAASTRGSPMQQNFHSTLSILPDSVLAPLRVASSDIYRGGSSDASCSVKVEPCPTAGQQLLGDQLTNSSVTGCAPTTAARTASVTACAASLTQLGRLREQAGARVKQLKESGLWEPAVQSWQQKHVADRKKLLQLILQATRCLSGTGGISAPRFYENPTEQNGWVDRREYAHRIGSQPNEPSKARKKRLAEQRAGPHAVAELFDGLPIWQDFAASGSFTPAELALVEAIWPRH